MMKLSGEFQVTEWQETTIAQYPDGSKRSHAKITQTYQGDLEGTSELEYQMFYQDEQCSEFTGVEVVTLASGDRRLVLFHRGKFANGVASSEFEIVQDTKGLLGNQSGRFNVKLGGVAQYVIE